MQRVKRGNLIGAINSILSNITMSISGKIQEYYSRKLIDFGLVARGFSYPFMFGEGGTSNTRKSIAKLKGILDKHLLKNNLAMSFAKEKFIQSDNGDYLGIHVASSGLTDGKMAVSEKELRRYNRISGTTFTARNLDVTRDGGGMADVITQCSKELTWTHRYARYLNYMFRKHSIPLYIAVNSNVEVVQAVENGLNVPKYKFTVKYYIYPVSYYLSGTQKARYQRLMESGTDSEKDVLYAEPNTWQHDTYNENPAGRLEGFEKFHISNVFRHIDKGVNIFQSLIRKIEYGVGAYTFRA